ncbi:MAG TPA: aminofutalosine synthase MqnE [Phycisphaerales bacterium]|nr:aminofutalosine synthase MqnE [Phycisphaerales bacterium]HIB50750.1 aminofutalosine synthase MqnE [Phycisphaerales bacterium]HIN83333.1 aminofutalosine synthase MqnE [Phycisphaerales bacterium]HIO53046.1 aminofutalosine synthase MqnE [Phycisphaerales bacterium]
MTTCCEINLTDTTLECIVDKVNNQERLTREDGIALYETPDLWTVCSLADSVRRRLHGETTYFNINRHINYSNVCALSCKFCDFYRKKDQEGAYEHSIDDIRNEATIALESGATEIHIVGGLHPWLPFEYYTDMLRVIREIAPNIHIKAFTAVEIVHFARITKRGRDGIAGISSVLSDLIANGLGSLPGGGAEVFDDRVHDEVFRGKIGSKKWMDVHRCAHELGLNSNATMLYGHVETREDRINHMIVLRDEQDRAEQNASEGKFQTMIPLPFIPGVSELSHLPGPSGVENLRTISISRLMLDNIPHIKAFWIMQTLHMAQHMLQCGANDIDGTVVWYDITKVSTETTHQECTTEDLKRAICDAGFNPVERDTLYRKVKRTNSGWSVE